MSTDNLDTAALQKLDEEPRRLLDIIDNLRSLGVDSYDDIELPQIIVVGDQSSGKSSVLEAISRVKFPAKNGLCTRFATELKLRTSSAPRVDVRIESSGHNDNPNRPFSWETESPLTLDNLDLEKIIEDAKNYLELGPGSTGFSDSVLRVEINGPKIPQLTLVDLPGFYHSGTAHQRADGRQIVEALAAKYMRQQCSIILAVVSAKSEIANQIVLEKAREHDPRKERTLGIITKPDIPEENSSEEKTFLTLAKNEETAHKLQLGWHVLRNRTEAEALDSNDKRDETEAAFFQRRVWRNLRSSDRGISELLSKLSTVLFNHIKQKLPDVIKAIEGNISKRRLRLIELGEARSTPGQHRTYLSDIAKQFESLARDAIRGLYTNDQFFGNVDVESQPSKRLRAHIRGLNRRFAHVLVQCGAQRLIQLPNGTLRNAFAAETSDSPFTGFHRKYRSDTPVQVSWKDLKRELEHEAEMEQGTEFPGSTNPWLAFQLFKKQALPWREVASHHIESVKASSREFIDLLLAHVVPDVHTRETILAECVDPFFDIIDESLESKLEELLAHYRGDYACQLDSEFMRHLTQRAVSIETEQRGISAFDTQRIINSMLTYYEMSLRTFTENVMILAVENCLIRKIPSIFEPTMVAKMNDDNLERLASETKAVRDEREMLEGALQVLEKGLKECRRYRPMTSSRTVRPTTPPPPTLVSPSIRVTEMPSPDTPSPQTPASSSGYGRSSASPTPNRRKQRKTFAAMSSLSPSLSVGSNSFAAPDYEEDEET